MPTTQYRLPALTTIVLLTLAYTALARIVLTVSTANGNVTIFWIPGGLALAALLIYGLRVWPGIFLGALAAGLLVDDPFFTSLLLASGNTLESVCAAYALRRVTRFDPDLPGLNDFWRLAAVAAICVPISAIIGPVSLFATGILSPESLPSNIGRWWQADFLGIVLGTPLFLALRRLPVGWFSSPRETLLTLSLFGASFVTGQIVFLDWFNDLFREFARAYWPFLFVVLIAILRGRHGVLLILPIIATQALIGASNGMGVYADDLRTTGLQNFWFYMISISMAGIPLTLYLEERDQAIANLKKTRGQVQRLVSEAPTSMAMFDRSMHYLAVSKPWQTEFSQGHASLIGKNHYDVHPDLPEAWKQAHQAGLSGQVLRNEESLWITADGSRIWTSWSITPWVDENGVVGGIIITNQDITERKLAEESIKASESQLRFITDHVPTFIAHRDRDLSFKFVNRTYAEFFGLSPNDFIGKYPNGILPDEPWSTTKPYMDQALNGETVNYTISHGQRTFLVSYVPERAADQKVVGFLVAATDITEQKRIEQDLEATKEHLRELMRMSSKLKDDERKYVAREIHDEIGQTLTAIKLEIGALRARSAQQAVNVSALDRIDFLADRSIQVVRDVTKSLRPPELELGLKAAIESLVESFERSTGCACSLIIDCHHQDISTHLLSAVYRGVQESLTNVIRHADASATSVTIECKSGMLTASISDNGRGFDATVISPSSLGLIGMRERAEMAGGQAHIDSRPGQGTTVTLSIPLDGTWMAHE